MTAAIEGGEWSAARPGRTLPPGKTRYPFYMRLGEPQGRSGRAENLVSTWIRCRTFQIVDQSLYRLSYRAHIPLVRSCIKGTSGRSHQKQLLKTPKLSDFVSIFLSYANFIEVDFIFWLGGFWFKFFQGARLLWTNFFEDFLQFLQPDCSLHLVHNLTH